MEYDTEELLVLWAARETGLLDALLSSADGPEAAAEEAGVTDRAAQITVDAFVEMGLLRTVDGAYEPTNQALGLLAQRDVRSIGELPHQLDCLTNWFALPETMHGAEPPIDHHAERPRQLAGAMAATPESTVRACVTEAVHAAPNATRVLDVGGGPGVFAREFADRGHEVTLVDRPETIEVVRPLLARTAVEMHAGDALSSLPSGFDLAFCARLLHGFDPAGNERLLASVFDALVPGGTIVAIDHVRGHSERAARFAAHTLAQTSAGNTYDEPTLRTWFEAADFDDIEIRDVPGTELQAIVAHRPA